MSSVQHLREFISARLAAAAAEIFSEVEKTIVQHEEEIDRQRRLLEITWKPHAQPHAQPADLPQHHACEEDKGSGHMETDSSLNQEGADPPQIKEEEEEIHLRVKDEPHVLQQESDALFTLEHDRSGPPTDWDQQLAPNSPQDKSLNEGGSEDEDVGSVTSEEAGHPINTDDAGAEKKLGLVSVKDKAHKKVQKLYFCTKCGRSFTRSDHLTVHMQTHTGERPYSCNVCEKRFAEKSKLTIHMRIHTGERPFSCQVCGKSFNQSAHLSVHRRTHTGEKPYSCNVCGKDFNRRNHVAVHMRTHTGEKPHRCKTCGKCTTARASTSRQDPGETPSSEQMWEQSIS